ADWARGELSPTSLRRTMHGIRLHREGLAPLLVLSGSRRRRPPSEAELRRALARVCDVPPDAVITDGPDDTRGGRPGAEPPSPAGGSEHPARHRCLSHGARRAAVRERGICRPDLARQRRPGPCRYPQARLALMARALQEILAAAYYCVANHF